MLKTIIIDDEPNVVKYMEVILTRQIPETEVVGTSDCPLKGIRLINELKPDLVFLDIHLPKITGFDLLECFQNRCFCLVIISACKEHADRAFEMDATDFLAKPFEKKEL